MYTMITQHQMLAQTDFSGSWFLTARLCSAIRVCKSLLVQKICFVLIRCLYGYSMLPASFKIVDLIINRPMGI